MHTIIGSGGAIGTPLAAELLSYTKNIRLVSRNPVKVNPTDELYKMDLTNFGQIEKAIEGSKVVYVVVGFKYKLSVWQKTWPPFLQAIIEGCKKHGAKLVFFDNVYMYQPSAIPFMTEQSAIGAMSQKGKVRQQLHEMIMREVEGNGLNALIARAADFYGPNNKSSALNLMVADNLIKGKKAQVFGDISKIHMYTYTPDAAKATALLGNKSEAFNQVWHMPTTKEKLTNQQWIELIAKELNVDPTIQPVPVWLMKVLGLFVPIMREFPEMMYQYQQDYIFDSSKIEKQFGLTATPPIEGVRLLIKSMKKTL